ncbi:MAG: small effector protein, partial [Candidatus Liberibacter psyllaurous]
NMKKLSLISTVAILSTAVSLGGCNNTKPKAKESADKVAKLAKEVATPNKEDQKDKEVTETKEDKPTEAPNAENDDKSSEIAGIQQVNNSN